MTRTWWTIILFLAIQTVQCSSYAPASHDRIMDEMRTVKTDLLKGRDPGPICHKRTLGRNGFFYLMDTTGTILCHPKTFLEGGNFGGNRFVKEIIGKKTGCFRYRMGETEFAVYFERVFENVVLCLSMETAEIRGESPGCPELK